MTFRELGLAKVFFIRIQKTVKFFIIILSYLSKLNLTTKNSGAQSSE